MKIIATIDSCEPNFVRLDLEQESLEVKKTVTYDSFKGIINQCGTSGQLARINKLPASFIDGNFNPMSTLTGTITLFLKGNVQLMAAANGKKKLHIPFPSLIFKFDVKQGIIQKSMVFSTTEKNIDSINDDTILYNYPYGNVSPYSGKICWGSNALPKLDSFRQLDTLVILFMNAPTNGDLYSPGNSTSLNCSLSELTALQAGNKIFPEELLVSAMLTFGQLLV